MPYKSYTYLALLKKKKKLPPFTEFILLVLMYPKNQSKAIRITGEHYYRVLPQGGEKKKGISNSNLQPLSDTNHE